MPFSFFVRAPTAKDAADNLDAAVARQKDQIPDDMHRLFHTALESLPDAPHDIDVRVDGHVEPKGSSKESTINIQVKHHPR